MHPFYSDYLERLQDLHAGIRKELSGLPPEALDWSPTPEMNSLGVLVVHLAGAERYWVGDVVMGEPSGRDRAAEFRQRGLDEEALGRKLDESLAYARSALERLGPEDLERECVSPRDGRPFRAAWALLHALEHTGIHLGHIQLTRQLWEGRARAGS